MTHDDSQSPGGHGARFSGSLSELAVADLAQLLALSRKSAVITVTHATIKSTLWCAGGAIVDAVSGRLRGEAAVYRVLAAEEGWCVAHLCPLVMRQRTVQASTQQLLLEGARRRDEAAAALGRLGGRRCRYALGVGVAVPQCRHVWERQLLEFFQTVCSLETALARSALGELESLQTIEKWVAARTLVQEEAEGKPGATSSSVVWQSQGRAKTESLRPLVSNLAVRQNATRARAGSSERSFRATLLGLALASVISPVAYWWGEGASAEPAAPMAQRSNLPQQASQGSASCERLEEFAVRVRVSPPSAELWLDGHQQNVSELQLRLPSNGEVHELVAKAPGFLPQRVIFRDASPPPLLQLEAMPQPALPIVLEPTIVSGGEGEPGVGLQEQTVAREALADGTSTTQLPSRQAAVPAAVPARQRTGKRQRRASGSEVARLARAERNKKALEGRARWEPQVQIIGGEEPEVGVLY